jgi:hypothetical protein
MEIEPDDFSIFPGDLSLYTLKCVRCGTSISPLGSIRETLFHAPIAILHHWNTIQPNEDTNVNEMMSILLLFTSYDSCLQLKKSFQEAVNSMSGDNEELVLKTYKNSSRNGQHRLYEAVKVDMANSKEKSFYKTQYQALFLSSLCHVKISLTPLTSQGTH